MQIQGNPALTAFQATVATGTATALPNNPCKSVVIKSLANTLVQNSDDIYIGGAEVTTSTGFALSPGDSWSDNISNTNLIYAISATAGQKLSVTYSN